MNERHARFFVDPNPVIVGTAVLQARVHRRRHLGEFASAPV
jgi:hypothetical protein